MITIKEVAELAGVSKATVSRVLNNSGYVSADTRKKITDIMEMYHYIPSAAAVALSRQESFFVIRGNAPIKFSSPKIESQRSFRFACSLSSMEMKIIPSGVSKSQASIRRGNIKASHAE